VRGAEAAAAAATQCIIHLALELEPFLGSVITPALPQEGFSLSCHIADAEAAGNSHFVRNDIDGMSLI
jgi:hypothetical protein